jgi:outer membrane protein insertion porin family
MSRPSGWILIGILVGVFAIQSQAQQSVSVIVMPFEIYAEEDLTYLGAQIADALKNSFKQEGATVIEPVVPPGLAWKESVQNTRKLGQQNAANYVVWGSMTRVGQKFSLDAKLLAVGEETPPSAISKEGEGIENLPPTVNALAREISLKLFKRERIVEIRVEGNQRIETDAIKKVVKSQPGDIYLAKSLSDDLKAVYAMGYFDDVRVEAENVSGGKAIIIKVKEKPTVHSIIISGNTWVYDTDKIKEEITVRKGSILNTAKVQNDIRRIKELYREKNFYNVKVTYKVIDREENQADLEYIIEEGKKLRITKIQFVGNKAYSDSKLRGLMSTSEANILSWFTSAGDLNQETLNQDVGKLTAFYQNNGYIQAKVGDPQVEFKEDGIEITIKIDEGSRFKVGKVEVTGELIFPKEQLLNQIKLSKEEFYDRETVRTDILTLTDLYADEGYAYVEIKPQIDEDKDKLLVNITYQIVKGKEVYFERINIAGNTKTRDKVIRRELQVYEQELFGSRRLKRSIQNLYRLDYFEDVKVNTTKGSADDKMVLDVDVKEKSTGSFSFGAGYGNVESFFVTASISERNLFGRGQTLSLNGVLGAKTAKYTLSFTEPWLFDKPLSAGFDIYNWNYSYPTYDKASVGGNLRLGYPVYDYTRGYLTYTLDRAEISNVEDDAPDSIKDTQGINVKSSITPKLRYDSRDSSFNPTKGSEDQASVEFAGLGGNVGFIKYLAETGWYRLLYWKLIGVAHAAGGYVNKLPNYDLPDYEKFYLGGINSLRGFDRDDLAPRDSNGDPIGGDKYVQFNFELRFPLVEQAGVFGDVFYDTGGVYLDSQDIDWANLRRSAGVGVRWLSPVGAIRLEYGWILDPEPTDHGSGKFEFSMGGAF